MERTRPKYEIERRQPAFAVLRDCEQTISCVKLILEVDPAAYAEAPSVMEGLLDRALGLIRDLQRREDEIDE
jgi:hypothetical protein